MTMNGVVARLRAGWVGYGLAVGAVALVSLFIGLGILMSVQANRKLVKT